MIREIITYPHKNLREVSKNVEQFDKKLHMLLDDMYETMLNKSGIGLAAIQVKIALNVLLINIPNKNDEQSKDDLLEIINPKIIQTSGKTTYTEGCLSVPEFYEDIQRAEKIFIEFQDREANIIQREFDSLEAIAIQHEIDHLNGILFVDKLSFLKRKKFEKEWKKRLKA